VKIQDYDFSVRVVEVTVELKELADRDERKKINWCDCPNCKSSKAMFNNGIWNTDKENEVRNNFCGVCGQRLEWG
jgi:transcription elongation factor Elf1